MYSYGKIFAFMLWPTCHYAELRERRRRIKAWNNLANGKLQAIWYRATRCQGIWMVCCKVSQDGWCHISANMPFWSMSIPSGPHKCGLLSVLHVAGTLGAGWGAHCSCIQGYAGFSSGPAGLNTSSAVPGLLNWGWLRAKPPWTAGCLDTQVASVQSKLQSVGII